MNRPEECKCSDNFTCGFCLKNPPVYFFTSGPTFPYPEEEAARIAQLEAAR